MPGSQKGNQRTNDDNHNATRTNEMYMPIEMNASLNYDEHNSNGRNVY